MPLFMTPIPIRTVLPPVAEVSLPSHFYSHISSSQSSVPFGSGLNTLSNFDWVDFSRTKWATCSDASESDCLTPKGFTFMRWRVDEGV